MINFDLIYVEGYELQLKGFYSFIPSQLTLNSNSSYTIWHAPGEAIIMMDKNSISSTTVKITSVQRSFYKIIGIKF